MVAKPKEVARTERDPPPSGGDGSLPLLQLPFRIQLQLLLRVQLQLLLRVQLPLHTFKRSTSDAGYILAPHTGRYIRLIPAIADEGASQAPTSEDYVRRNPCPRADDRRGLYIAGRTVSAATTVADPIGNLAALHQHVARRGRVVVLIFCHSELLTSANARFAKCRAFKVRRKRFEEVVLLLDVSFGDFHIWFHRSHSPRER